MATTNDGNSLQKTLMLIFKQKNHIYPSLISWNIAKILETCYHGYFEHVSTSTKNNINNLQETLMVIYMQKINLIPRFFCEILHFKEFSNSIHRGDFDQ